MKTISEQRIKHCLGILNKRENEKQIIKERLDLLSFQLLHLLDEIEEFSIVVYCKSAAACWLDNDVLKILAGSIRWNGKPIEKDTYFGKPSPASQHIVGRSSDGWREWKNSHHKSMKEISSIPPPKIPSTIRKPDDKFVLPIGLKLHKKYKGKTFTAVTVEDNEIRLDLDGKTYSLNHGTLVCIRTVSPKRASEDAWRWWKCSHPKTGKEVLIDVLRNE